VLEPCAVKVARTVLKGGKCSNAPTYPKKKVLVQSNAFRREGLPNGTNDEVLSSKDDTLNIFLKSKLVVS
jgi:hypothetical protein